MILLALPVILYAARRPLLRALGGPLVVDDDPAGYADGEAGRESDQG